jgi:hypothetical protein
VPHPEHERAELAGLCTVSFWIERSLSHTESAPILTAQPIRRISRGTPQPAIMTQCDNRWWREWSDRRLGALGAGLERPNGAPGSS